MVRIPAGLAGRLGELSRDNDLADPQFGRDVFIMYERNQKPEKMYSLEAGDRTVLSKKELAYLRYSVDKIVPQPLKPSKVFQL